ncbi:MAG: arylsulfatase [Aquiluna sp.]
MNHKTTSKGSSLPSRESPFLGHIGLTVANSTPCFPAAIEAPEGAPNILLIMTDDVGFGASSVFGGPVPTPAFANIAEQGIKYNHFHTTALCSPSRAALLTGRNPHNANTGIIMERCLGYPGYNSVLPNTCGTIGEVLRQNGYNTAWFGKNHNTPTWELSSAGPFDRWPTGLGFEYFYGFQGGDCNQWAPSVYQNTTPIEPGLGRKDYHLDTDLADQAILWIAKQKAIAPEKPFLAYYAPGATHAPHHVPEEWIDLFKGQFDCGWDQQRELTWKRQVELGVIPAGTGLTPRPKNIPAWDELDARSKDLFSRMMEIYAAYLHFTDHNIGRVVESIKKTGQLDNTLIIYIMGDNGGSGEGTLQGSANELAVVGNGESETLEYLYSIKDDLGGPLYYNHFPVGWCWAMNTPFQWMKRYASHFGGTRNGMAISWPKRIKDRGGIRNQFHHITDIAPTIFHAAGIEWPVQELNGITQKPLDGISMDYTWDSSHEAGRRRTQYFEMFGNRAIFHQDDEGMWLACTTPLVFSWVSGSDNGKTKLEDFEFELYKIDNDFSQYTDLAKDPNYARKLEELKGLWWSEAGKNQVLPLNFSVQATVSAALQRPSLTRGRNYFEYTDRLTRLPESCAPNLKNTSFRITADIELPEGLAEGVIATQGGRFGGWGLLLLEGRPVWCYRRSQEDTKSLRLEGEQILTAGNYLISVICDYDDPQTLEEVHRVPIGRSGTFRIEVNGHTVAGPASIDRTVRALFSVDETFDVGEDTGTPIIEDYAERMPFRFNGHIRKVVIELLPHRMPPDVETALLQALGLARSQALLATE